MAALSISSAAKGTGKHLNSTTSGTARQGAIGIGTAEATKIARSIATVFCGSIGETLGTDVVSIALIAIAAGDFEDLELAYWALDRSIVVVVVVVVVVRWCWFCRTGLPSRKGVSTLTGLAIQ